MRKQRVACCQRRRGAKGKGKEGRAVERAKRAFRGWMEP
jgi:hypothetical protein